MTLVWNLDPAVVSCSERLVLLCLADHAHHDGRGAWPSVATMARRTSLTCRAIQKILPRLADKHLIVKEGKGARGSIRYALHPTELEHQRCGVLQRQAENGSRSDDRQAAADSTVDSQSSTADDDLDEALTANHVRSHCEPRSQSAEPSTANHVHRGGEPRSQRGEPRSQICEPRSPDPDLNRHEPSLKKDLGGSAPRRGASTPSRSYAVATDQESSNELRHSPDDAPMKTTTPEDPEADYRRLKQLAAVVVSEDPTVTFEQQCEVVRQRATAMSLTPNGHLVGLAVTRCRQLA